jgi:short-subunit dehydrogenase
MLATYTGTKAFLSTFTSALAEEVKSHNIIVEHVNTYFVVRAHFYIHRDKFNSDSGIQTIKSQEAIGANPAA